MQKMLVSVVASLFMFSTAHAQQSTRPGLWEVTTRSDLLALVPHIPSEHMQQLTLLAKRYGLKLPEVDNGAATSHLCITPEMAQQDIPTYFYENRSGCTIQNATRNGNQYSFDLSCANQYFQGNGSAQGTLTSNESFAGHIDFDSTVSGNSIPASAETSARWIAERCVAINPLQ